MAQGSGADLPGYSIGKWLDTDGDGRYDTLEVETRNIRGPKTWDQTGMPMADDNEAVIKERLYLDKANPNILHDEITTTDNSLTRPWSVVKNYRRSNNVIWFENNLHRGQPVCHHRGADLLRERRGQAHAHAQGPAAAGFDVFQAGAEVTERRVANSE